MSEDPTQPPVGATCCLLRRKILVGILRVLSEEECGVPESELADVLRFDLASPQGRPVLAFRFCPWCGKERDLAGETRIVDVAFGPPPGASDEDEEPGWLPPEEYRPGDEPHEEEG